MGIDSKLITYIVVKLQIMKAANVILGLLK